MNRKLTLALAVLMIASLLGACAPAPAPAVVVQTVEVEKQVVQTVEVEKKVIETVEVVKEVAVTPMPEGAKPTGTLRVALSGDPNSLYIPATADKNSDIAASQLYDPLVFQDDDGNIVPALAERWEVSADGTEYTFYLREGVVFHNGEPFNADDVIATWEYGKGEGSAWPDRYAVATSVEKVNDFTVKVTTDGPKPLLLVTMHDFWSIIPNEYMAEVGVDGFQQAPVGTGPFQFVEWAKGDHITYKANPNYWREGQPKIETLIFRPIPESAIRVAALQTDEIDLAQRLSAEEAQSLLGVEGIQVVKYPVARIFYITFNNLTSGVGEPTENAKVRQAMNYAVDVDAIIDALFNGFGKRAAGYVASGERGYGIVEPFPYDPEKAKALLAEAGFADGFEMEMACPAGAYGSFEEVCQAVTGYLGEVGIKVTLNIMESAQYWDLQAKKELPPLFGDSWADESGEAYNRLAGALGGNEAPYSAWTDPEIDRLLKAISTEVDAEKRTKLYEELQVYMFDNPPFIYLYEPMTFEAVRDRVQDYKPRPSEIYYLNSTWVAVSE
ncbi:MAG: ABC transporter substrate-binding protein [Planctomycetes bacterium]|nr:ABC transporter substrate-binding protein [Planctomycetota bacterium]